MGMFLSCCCVRHELETPRAQPAILPIEAMFIDVTDSADPDPQVNKSTPLLV